MNWEEFKKWCKTASERDLYSLMYDMSDGDFGIIIVINMMMVSMIIGEILTEDIFISIDNSKRDFGGIIKMITNCKECGKPFESFNYKHKLCNKCFDKMYAKVVKKFKKSIKRRKKSCLKKKENGKRFRRKSKK